ncbi:HvfC/BufC family peptide modification chaperone [Maricaulis sp. CAU 1757]
MPEVLDDTRFYRDFAHFLETGELARIAPHIADQGALSQAMVYRNTVVRSAIEALRAAYPALDRHLGPDVFGRLAHAYWRARPPQRRTMTLYGEAMADFIDARAAAAADAMPPRTADLARHDRAWLEAHHAADASSLRPAEVAQLDPSELPGLAPGLHPSVRLLAPDAPIYADWVVLREPDGPLPEAAPACVIWRRDGVVRHAGLNHRDHVFLLALSEGLSLSQATGRATGQPDSPDTAAIFGRALGEAWLNGEKRQC